MLKSEKKILSVQIVLLFVFFLNIFMKFIHNDYVTFLILVLAVLLLSLLVGYEKHQVVDKITEKRILKYVAIYCISFLVFEYALGYLFNYVSTPYKKDPINIIKNILPTVLIILSSEYLRGILIRKGGHNKFILVFTVLMFIILDLSINAVYFNLSEPNELLKFLSSVFLVSIFRNVILTRFTYYYGIKQNIVYRLILELYLYVMPFIPDLGTYLESVLLMIFPFILNIVMMAGFEKEKRKDYRENKPFRKILNILVIMILAIIVSLNSNIFRFWMVMVASGSMEPTIKIGDAVIIDKSYQKHIDRLQVGDILAFNVGKKIYVHRIIDIQNENGNYNIKTKGDREGQSVDNWRVTNKDIIGVVKLRIKYIGYPTVWLSWKMEDKNG